MSLVTKIIVGLLLLIVLNQVVEIHFMKSRIRKMQQIIISIREDIKKAESGIAEEGIARCDQFIDVYNILKDHAIMLCDIETAGKNSETKSES